MVAQAFSPASRTGNDLCHELFIENRGEHESFREYVMRNRVETFRELTSDLAKPAELFPEIYQDWGDEEAFSLKLGRGECAA